MWKQVTEAIIWVIQYCVQFVKTSSVFCLSEIAVK
jgi:hypothetical protein